MECKKILIIKYDIDDFEQFCNEQIMNRKIDIISLDSIRTHYPGKKIKNTWNFLKAFIFNPSHIEFNKYDIIIIFDDEKIIPIANRYKKKDAKVILWNWNIKTKKQAKRQNKYGRSCEIWTFDKKNAVDYGWKLNNQFYFKPRIVDEKKNKGMLCAFCACVDKGRYKQMKEIKSALEKLNIKCNFFLVKEQGKNYMKEDRQWVVEKGIAYGAFLENVKNSDLIVDLVQNGQVGMTLRVLEALFYNKKIITNNDAIKETPIYNSNNILIWNSEEKAEIQDFIKKDYEVISNSIKNQYTFENWIQNIIER